MTKETTPAGLLSKVVKFVRHPATSWNDLDTMSESRDQNYSKQALKEMIERKRRNDFVRKREFDMLRKLRNQPGSVERGYGGRPSFFQSSYSSRPDDRAGTLKKIDEIEAQMSQQWWKTKQRDSRAVEDDTPPQDAIDTIRGYRTTIPNSQHMATEPMSEEVLAKAAAARKLQHQAVTCLDDVNALVRQQAAGATRGFALAAGKAALTAQRGIVDAVEGGGRNGEGGGLAVGNLDHLRNAAAPLARAT